MLKSFRQYLPLIIVLSLALLMALVIDSATAVTSLFMGFFFCLLSMFKLFDVSGFADGFQKYDIVAGYFRPYAFFYPFVELGLGLGYLAHFMPLLINIITLIVMTLSLIGVINSLRKGLDVRCACLGTVLNVPLSTVSVVENIGMGLMAFANILAWAR